MTGITDSGQHEQLRRVDRAAAQNHLLVGDATLNVAVMVDKLDADGADAVEQNSSHQNVGFDFDVRPRDKNSVTDILVVTNNSFIH